MEWPEPGARGRGGWGDADKSSLSVLSTLELQRHGWEELCAQVRGQNDSERGGEREGTLSEEVTAECSHVQFLGDSIPGRGSCKCKGSEAGTSLKGRGTGERLGVGVAALEARPS